MFATADPNATTAPGAQHLDATFEPRLHPVDAEDELLAILARVDRLQAQAAEALGRVNDLARWRRRGYTSATAFLKHRAGMTAGNAMRLVGRANSLQASRWQPPLWAVAHSQSIRSTAAFR